MSPYKHDMSEEKEPTKRVLLPEGNRLFTIVNCEEQTSKAGNLMFKMQFKDKETESITDVYAVAVKGKRWFLKSVLEAVGAPKDESGEFVWDIPDVLDKQVLGEVVHEDNEWINRDGETIKSKQHRIKNVSVVAWDE